MASLRNRREAVDPEPGEPGSVWGDLAWILEDGRRVVRLLRRNARYGLVAVVLLAVGIGANVATVSIVRRTLLPRLRDAHAEGMVWVWQRQLEHLGTWRGTGPSCAHVTRPRWIRLPGLHWT